MDLPSSSQKITEMLLFEIMSVTALQSQAANGDESAYMRLVTRSQALANISAAIAHMNAGQITQIDTTKLDEAWMKVRLEFSIMPPCNHESGNPHRAQVADLILVDEDDNDLVVTSDLTIDDDEAMSFQIGEPEEDGARYKVTIKITEIAPSEESEPDDKFSFGGLDEETIQKACEPFFGDGGDRSS